MKFLYEQPLVQFKDKLIYQYQGLDISSLKGYSTIPEYNDLLGKSATKKPLSINSYETDYNYDSLNDEIQVNFTIPIDSTNNEQVNKLNVIYFFDFQLQTRARIDMETALILSAESIDAGSIVYFNGNLQFNQLNTLSSQGIKTDYVSDIIDPVELKHINDISMNNIYNLILERNDTTTFNGITYWRSWW